MRDLLIGLLIILVCNLCLALHRQRLEHADAEALIRETMPHVKWAPPEEFRLTNPEPELH
jgi:hypothetical protein